MNFDKAIFFLKFRAQLENQSLEVEEDTYFRKLEDWDSMTALLIISMIFDEYEVSITGDDFLQIYTVGQLADWVQNHMN